MTKVITRFAPSPTGHLHIGGARTAIFSWLLAKHFNGEFLLRIEDTDFERSKQEYTDSILASMAWLGLTWSGETIYQSKRLAVYNEYVDKLLSENKAYWCKCTPQELEARREEAKAKGEAFHYDGRCRSLNLEKGEGYAVRLKIPSSGMVRFDDLVKGQIAIDVNELDDMVIRRADGTPTYNLAVVVDDATMGVSVVLRGDDHVSNTPKQILIYEALGFKQPQFGHVPMILGADRQKLSKRHGAKAVIDYKEDGLLPEALVNYLVRLGWSHGDQELFNTQELIELFTTDHLNNSAAGFDPEKLLWINAQHLRSKSPEELYPLLEEFLNKLGLNTFDKELILRLIPLYQPRVNTLVELAEALRPALSSLDKLEYEPKAAAQFSDEGKMRLKALSDLLTQIDDKGFDVPAVENCIHKYVEDNSLKFKQVGPVLRAALTGQSGGPSLPEFMSAIGKNNTLLRIKKVLL
ncbi:glutamate--tRNA ligase [Desulfovibrio litoralis]|uniref:Glutamate--tRNA ligase n=1 Tax=Desulfovibrio litoralis DSM 11393 TaxID=1121455 RepID=A0A1M7RVZ6_9BACT|nr:glutamate--tRNA ligase [Desulfovibrio litoralis]SHN50479.1 glutamyl-tRNA synthetase [Desulfovibrio litoralis DSM 11393]